MLTLLVLLHVPGPATTQVTLTSLYPNHPSIAISTSSIVLVQVPLGHTGAIISCTGFGTPTPIMIKWIRIGQVLDARRIYSESISGENSAFVSARLTLTGKFSLLDVGDYSCVIQANLANNTELAQSYVISIESAASNQLSPVSIPIMCLANSSVTYFQFRVLNTDCSAWAEEKKQNIAERFMNVLKNAISAECQDCVTVIIEITNTPTCSPIVGRAAVFRGKIGTPQRERAFCALHSWIQYRPLVFLDGNSSTLHFLDYNCPIQTESLISAECKPTPNLGSSASAVGTSIVVILLLVVVVASAIIAGVFVKRYGLIGQQRYIINMIVLSCVCNRINFVRLV